MPSANGHYDQNLLAAAPAATKAQLQEGYNPDLLGQTQAKPTPPPTDPGHVLVAKEQSGDVPARPVPFWRTRKGMIIIFVAFVVVIGAVVGGAVGATAGKEKKKDDKNDSLVTGSSAAVPPNTLSPPSTPAATAAQPEQPVASSTSGTSIVFPTLPSQTTPTGNGNPTATGSPGLAISSPR